MDTSEDPPWKIAARRRGDARERIRAGRDTRASQGSADPPEHLREPRHDVALERAKPGRLGMRAEEDPGRHPGPSS